MASLPIPTSPTPRTHRSQPPMAALVFLTLLILPLSNAISFNFTSFNPNMGTIFFQGDAFSADGKLQITKNTRDYNLTNSAGRATYRDAVRLHDARTGRLADFTSHFRFVIRSENPEMKGDGLSFFLAPNDSQIPANSSGGYLALFSPDSAPDGDNKDVQIVAVEFDSFRNPAWDLSDDHVGIDVNSIKSVRSVAWNTSIKNGTVANAWISYDSTTKNLSVFLTYSENPVFHGNCSLWYEVDLREVLPEWVRVGFSAATGDWVETHNVLSWEFSSTLEEADKEEDQMQGGNIRRLAIGLPVGVSACFLLGLSVYFWKRRKINVKGGEQPFDASMDLEFAKGTGPKMFTYQELARATSEFDLAGKLGEGGFGGVYKGTLPNSKTEVAVKRVSRGSKQGKKEYVSEVKIISRLRHRNLVQLIGWCHEQGELLLVYEYLPNGSLDSHLFGGKPALSWSIRYKIALGLASSLLYLHEEWEQYVVHRDIKSSNIMLDSNFNAKLGDFGLARLVDHDLGSQTTVLAGTMGYLAPECVTTGKASKESDVYSFGVVALEITCGRKPVEPKQEPGKVRLIEWVWELYGKGRILEALDKKLAAEYDLRQVESLMTVGLWCCHPDSAQRPSIRQVINVLKFEAPLPSLPSSLPVPMYYAPPMNILEFTYTTTGIPSSGKSLTNCSSATGSTNSSVLSGGGSTRALLKKGDA